jgi:hypothetical protein
MQMHFPASNNAAEYEALLIVNQVNKEWSCLDDKMPMYCQELRKLENNFDSLEDMHIL